MKESEFGIDENNESSADKKLEKKKLPNIPFETKQTVVEYWRSSKKKILKTSVFKNLKSPIDVNWKVLVTPIQYTILFYTFPNELKQLIFLA